jgi:hypothetical protein
MKSDHIFINLSHHPSRGWSEKQLESAREYGKIIDVTFPLVEPNTSYAQVKQLADDCVANIPAKGDPANLTVHIMGEMTLTALLLH